MGSERFQHFDGELRGEPSQVTKQRRWLMIHVEEIPEYLGEVGCSGMPTVFGKEKVNMVDMMVQLSATFFATYST